MYIAYRPSVEIYEAPEHSTRLGTKETRKFFGEDYIPDESKVLSACYKNSELLFGEEFVVDESSLKDGWVSGHSAVDGYPGFVRFDDLRESEYKSNCFVNVPISLLYPEPSNKFRPVYNLSFMSRLCCELGEEVNGFVKCKNSGNWIHRSHIMSNKEQGENIVDHVGTALQFLNAPYRLGGRAFWGIDCSALVQLCLMRNGISCQRDTCDQVMTLGKAVNVEDLSYGDFIFFKGHVAIYLDDDKALNVTKRYMRAVIEPLEDVVSFYEGISAVRRV